MATSASLNVQVSSKGVDTTKKKLKGLTTEGQKAEKKVGKLQGKFKDFGKNAGAAVAAIDGPLGGVSSRLSALTTVATAGGLAMTALAVAVTAATFAITKGVKELDELNVALARSEALIKATGGAAGFTAQQLQDQARATAFATLASVKGIQEAQSILLTFNNVSGQVFTDAIGLAQDMATVFGGTAASGATQLGKALQDPVAGISALSRVGVTFNKQQKEQIKTLTESGKILKAQAIIVQTLKDQIGGVAEAVSRESLAGSLDTLGQAFDEFTIQVADNAGALDWFQGVVDQIGRGIQRATKIASPDTAAEASKKALDLLFKISEEEAKIAKMSNSIAKRSAEGRVILLKAQRQTYLDYAKTVADAENRIRLAQGKAAEDAIRLQRERAKAAAEAKAASDRKKVQDSAELASFTAATDGIQADWERRVAITQAASLRVSEASKAQFVAEAEESFDFRDRLTAQEEFYISAREKAKGQNDILTQIDTEQKAALETLELDHQSRLSEIRREAAEERQKEALKETQGLISAYSGLASGVATAFGGITDALESSGDDSSAAYKTMFALQKGFTTASATLAFSNAVIQAMADPSAITLPQKLANYAAVATTGGQLLSAISSATYSGRAQGGQVNPDGTYMIGERGPELVTFGRGGGSVMNNSNTQKAMQPSGGKTNYTVVNQTSGTVNEVEEQQVTPNDVVLILRETMPGEIKNSNSPTSKALSRNTSNRRRLR